MLNNVDLFNECLDNRVPNIDEIAREALNKVIIPREKGHSQLIIKNSELIKLIDQFDQFNIKGDETHNEEIISQIDDCLKFEGMNLCPFSQYLMVHDLTHDIYLSKLTTEEKEFVLKCYIKDRHCIYNSYGYSNIILQVLNDNYSHKRKSVIGVKKLEKACEDNGILHFNGDFSQDKFFLLPDNGEKDLFKEALKHYHIKFDFAKQHQDKMPDAFIKFNDKFIIVEHKKMKDTGGGQDKQLTEIIDFIKCGERNVFYVSYLDGILFNELINPSERRKLYKQKKDIIKNLKENDYNYFVNEFGFNKLLADIIK